MPPDNSLRSGARSEAKPSEAAGSAQGSAKRCRPGRLASPADNRAGGPRDNPLVAALIRPAGPAQAAEEALDEVVDLGLDVLFDSDNIVIIEWAQRFPEMIPKENWWVEIDWRSGDETVRRIKIDHRTSS